MAGSESLRWGGMKKKVNALELIQKIEKLTKERMAGQDVVSLDQFRDLRKKLEPKTLLANRVRKLASSIAVSPPPTTATSTFL